MGIIAFLILGLAAGAIAKWLLPGPDPGGILATMGIGVLGALLGGFLGGALLGVDPLAGFFEFSTWAAAIVGSVVLLALYKILAGRRRVVR